MDCMFRRRKEEYASGDFESGFFAVPLDGIEDDDSSEEDNDEPEELGLPSLMITLRRKLFSSVRPAFSPLKTTD